MDSRLDSIFRTTFRQTESTDTWMGIRREEPRDDQRRKKDEDDDKKEKPQWEDDTVVSISALRQFLSTLIAADSPLQQPQSSPSPVTDMPPPSSQQQRAHNAASAYQNTARHTALTPAPPAAEPIPAPALSSEENRAIYQLINDLDILQQNGMTSLQIQKEGSFLESLQKAAQKALAIVT